MSHLKIGASLVIWPKNDAKEQEKEKEKEKKKKKKENVGFFSVNSSFFLARKKCNHHENLSFCLIRYGSSYEIPRLLAKQQRLINTYEYGVHAL